MRKQFFWRYVILLLPAPVLALTTLALFHAVSMRWVIAAATGVVTVLVSAFLAARQRANRRIAFLAQARAMAEERFDVRIGTSGLSGDVLADAWNEAATALGNGFAELRRTREQLFALLNSLQEGVLAVDPNCRITWANGAVEELTQHPAVLGTPLVHTVRDPDALALVNATLSTGRAMRGLARSIQDGRVFEVSATPMPTGAVAVLTDVTEKAQMEATRRDFIANVSHELRTPLTSIRGYVETLMETENLDDEQRDFLSIILKNARRMGRLTEDLLALARVESGEHKLRLEPIASSVLLDDVTDSLSGLVEEYGMVLEVAFSTEREVLADRDAVHQVLANLIENASRYASDGGRILLGAVEKSTTVELFVRDFGPGIRSEHLQRIFERFYRVDKARSMETGGTGLGLAIAKHIALAHGGSLRAESVLNRGATFILSLPAVESMSSTSAETPMEDAATYTKG